MGKGRGGRWAATFRQRWGPSRSLPVGLGLLLRDRPTPCRLSSPGCMPGAPLPPALAARQNACIPHAAPVQQGQRLGGRGLESRGVPGLEGVEPVLVCRRGEGPICVLVLAAPLCRLALDLSIKAGHRRVVCGVRSRGARRAPVERGASDRAPCPRMQTCTGAWHSSEDRAQMRPHTPGRDQGEPPTPSGLPPKSSAPFASRTTWMAAAGLPRSFTFMPFLRPCREEGWGLAFQSVACPLVRRARHGWSVRCRLASGLPAAA